MKVVTHFLVVRLILLVLELINWNPNYLILLSDMYLLIMELNNRDPKNLSFCEIFFS